jgi:hypothetical protein
MLVCTPLVEAKQDCSIPVDDLAEVVMLGSRLRLAKQRLVPFETAGHIDSIISLVDGTQISIINARVNPS